jgi:hypothetical protein
MFLVEASMTEPLYNITCYPYGDSGILVLGGQVPNDPDPSATAKSVRFWSDKDTKWVANDTRLVQGNLCTGKGNLPLAQSSIH